MDDGRVLGGRNGMGKTVMGSLEDPEFYAFYMLICTKCLHTICPGKLDFHFRCSRECHRYK